MLHVTEGTPEVAAFVETLGLFVEREHRFARHLMEAQTGELCRQRLESAGSSATTTIDGARRTAQA